MGPDEDNDFTANPPSVAWNSRMNQYLVAWHGDDNSGGLVDEEDSWRLHVGGSDLVTAPRRQTLAPILGLQAAATPERAAIPDRVNSIRMTSLPR
jgi:hypothetical protein